MPGIGLTHQPCGCVYGITSVFLGRGSRAFMGFAERSVTPERTERACRAASSNKLTDCRPLHGLPHFSASLSLGSSASSGTSSQWPVPACTLTHPTSDPRGIEPSWLGGSAEGGTVHPLPRACPFPRVQAQADPGPNTEPNRNLIEIAEGDRVQGTLGR